MESPKSGFGGGAPIGIFGGRAPTPGLGAEPPHGVWGGAPIGVFGGGVAPPWGLGAERRRGAARCGEVRRGLNLICRFKFNFNFKFNLI